MNIWESSRWFCYSFRTSSNHIIRNSILNCNNSTYSNKKEINLKFFFLPPFQLVSQSATHIYIFCMCIVNLQMNSVSKYNILGKFLLAFHTEVIHNPHEFQDRSLKNSNDYFTILGCASQTPNIKKSDKLGNT